MDFITARKQFVKQQQQMRPGSSRKAPRQPTPVVALGCVVVAQKRKGKANQAMTQANFSLIQSLYTRSTQNESHPFPTLSPRTLDAIQTLPSILNGRYTNPF